MIHPDMPASEYHARPAVSAGLLWDIIKPDGCEALAYYNSQWLNPDFVPVVDELLQNGSIAHLAVLEEEKLDAAITIIDARDYRSAKAKLLRDEAIGAGKIPILLEREPGSPSPSFKKIVAMRQALEKSFAAALLFGPNGINEVSYTFTLDDIACKCRADRIIRRSGHSLMLDLKTSISASPDYFQRAMWNFGHHLRAPFYVRGWNSQDSDEAETIEDYVFVVVQRDPPHLVALYKIDVQSLAWGERMYTEALRRFRHAFDTGNWPGFMQTPAPQTMTLPTWAIHQLADREALGEL